MIKKLLNLLTGASFRLYIGGGGGGQQQQPTTQTVQQTNLPAWAQPYSEQLLGKAQALTDTNQNDYQSYGGERLAGFTPMQQQAFGNIANMQVSPQTGQATGLAGMAGLGGLGAGQNYMNMATSPAATQAFMSPYMQNVVDWQKQQAIMDYARDLSIPMAATRSGAFGGSRQALQESEAQRNLQNTLAGIQATGSQNAFNAAQQAQQFGANLGMQGLGLAGQAAQTLGQLGQQQYGQQMGINAAQQQAGAQQQALQQQQLTNQYQDWLNRQNYPYQQLAFMSDILHGTPTGGITTAQQYQAAPSMANQIMGYGLGAYGLSKLFGKEGGSVPGGLKKYAKGGEVKYNVGGAVDSIEAQYQLARKMGISRLQQIISGQTPSEISPVVAAAAMRELQQAQTAAQGMQAQQELAREPGTVLDRMKAQQLPQEMGVEALDTDNLKRVVAKASGGIIGFAEGDIVDPRVLDRIKAARDAAREAYRAAGVGADAAGVGADAAGAEAAGAKAGAEAGAKAESMFSRARKAFQPKPGILNPNISGEGIMKGLSKARVLGAPLLAYDLGTTAYDIANTPTDVIRKYYGYTDEPSFLGDVAARSRAALGSLVPFSSTSEDLRALRQQQASAAPAASASVPQSQYNAQDLAESYVSGMGDTAKAAPAVTRRAAPAAALAAPKGLGLLNASPTELAAMQANIDAQPKVTSAPVGIEALEQAGPPAPKQASGLGYLDAMNARRKVGFDTITEAIKQLGAPKEMTDSDKGALALDVATSYLTSRTFAEGSGSAGAKIASKVRELNKTNDEAKRAALNAQISMEGAKMQMEQGDMKHAVDLINHADTMAFNERKLKIEQGQWTDKKQLEYEKLALERAEQKIKAMVGAAQAANYYAEASTAPAKIAYYLNKPASGAITPAVYARISNEVSDDVEKLFAKPISASKIMKQPEYKGMTEAEVKNALKQQELNKRLSMANGILEAAPFRNPAFGEGEPPEGATIRPLPVKP